VPRRTREATLGQLHPGDYFEGKPGSGLQKIIREVERDGARWIGTEDIDGKRRRINVTKWGHLEVTQVLFGPTAEQAIANVAAGLGAKVLAEQVEHKWFHPAHSVLEADEALMRAHLVRFHLHHPDDDHRLGDMIVNHRGFHKDADVDHEHNEEHRA
jgi:hypothetical protein